jgi:surfeit locus 1 family protein
LGVIIPVPNANKSNTTTSTEKSTRRPKYLLIGTFFSPLTITNKARPKLTNMNSSSSTKTNLKMKSVFIKSPKIGAVGAWCFIVLSTLIVFSILVKLGFWQLERAEQKKQWQAALIARQSATVLSFEQLLMQTNNENLTGYKLSTQATPTLKQVFLLDNQTVDGKVGYLAYQAFEISPSKPWLLVELGFAQGGIDRAVLPMVPAITKPLQLTGRVYQKEMNPMSSELMPEPGWPKRIQNLNIEQLALLIDKPLVRAVLQPNNIPNDNRAHPWQPIPLSAQKHQGYAVQWFSMAGVFGMLILYLLFRKLKQ